MCVMLCFKIKAVGFFLTLQPMRQSMLETKRTAFCPRKAHLQPFPMPAMLILFSASAAGSVAALGDPVQARCSDLLAEALRAHERQLAEIRSSHENVIRELRVQLDGRTAELDGLRRTCAATKHEFANTARAKNETWRSPVFKFRIAVWQVNRALIPRCELPPGRIGNFEVETGRIENRRGRRFKFAGPGGLPPRFRVPGKSGIGATPGKRDPGVWFFKLATRTSL